MLTVLQGVSACGEQSGFCRREWRSCRPRTTAGYPDRPRNSRSLIDHVVRKDIPASRPARLAGNNAPAESTATLLVDTVGSRDLARSPLRTPD